MALTRTLALALALALAWALPLALAWRGEAEEDFASTTLFIRPCMTGTGFLPV